MSKSIYQRKNELFRLWNDLKKVLNDDSLSFDKYMKIREKEEQAYHKWYFYDKFTKACNKLKQKDDIASWKVVRK